MNARSLPSPSMRTFPSSPLVEWFRPDEDIDIFLSGSTLALRDLYRQLRRVECFLRCNIDPPTRVLFSGPSGTGKTLAARWLACRLDAPLALANLAALAGSHLGEGQRLLTELFETVGKVDDAILFLDEIDAMLPNREEASGDAGTEKARSTATFFQLVDRLKPARVVIAATNFEAELDPALRRRFTTHIAFEPPDLPARLAMLRLWLDKAPVPDTVLVKTAEENEGLSGAELRAKAMEIARRAIMNTPEPPRKLHPVAPRPDPTPPQERLGLPEVPDVELYRAPKRPYQAPYRPEDEERAPDGAQRLKTILTVLDNSKGPTTKP